MFKRISSASGLMIFSLFFTLACSNGAQGEVKASLNKSFDLPVGQTAVIAGEDLKIQFEAVESDSRCPRGVECIWAGEAKCRTIVTTGQTPAPLVLVVSGGAGSQTEFAGYKFKFNLEPYPQAGQTTGKDAYILTMMITK